MRRKAAEKAAKAGGRGADKATKKPWWQEELDGAAAAKRTSKADDDISAYRAEACTTCPLPHCWPTLAHCLLSDGYLSALYVPVGSCEPVFYDYLGCKRGQSCSCWHWDDIRAV